VQQSSGPVDRRRWRVELQDDQQLRDSAGNGQSDVERSAAAAASALGHRHRLHLLPQRGGGGRRRPPPPRHVVRHGAGQFAPRRRSTAAARRRRQRRSVAGDDHVRLRRQRQQSDSEHRRRRGRAVPLTSVPIHRLLPAQLTSPVDTLAPRHYTLSGAVTSRCIGLTPAIGPIVPDI